jgi:hypothetical protein
MKKTVLTFGLISVAILSVMMLVTVPFQDAIGWDKGEILGYTTMLLAGLLIYFGVRSYRDLVGGELSFGRALAVGAMIAAVASVCYVVTWEVIYYKLSPDFPQKYQAHMIENAKASGASQAEIDKRVADAQKFAEMYKNPAINAAITFLEPLPVGLVIALVSAGVLGRRRKTKESSLAPA